MMPVVAVVVASVSDRVEPSATVMSAPDAQVMLLVAASETFVPASRIDWIAPDVITLAAAPLSPAAMVPVTRSSPVVASPLRSGDVA